ncbi:ATP-dependent nuclease [Parafilimonas sp.]|uniref:ATP-dependent nuclease n=1 Tax=Parafilimonas sp. TaxID=1969739 RepID=UPI0039E2C3B7
MPKLKSISIENFRSIGEEPVVIKFFKNKPIILIGENNCGKTNIIRSIELMFGEFHPKYKNLEDYDHFLRNPKNKIVIDAEVIGFKNRLGRNGEFTCSGFGFTCEKNKGADFYAIQSEDGNTNHFVSNNLREELLCVVVNAEQNLSYQLSYSSKFTLLSKVTKSFHERLSSDEEKVKTLKELFDTIKGTFLKVEEFKNFNDNMSTIAGQMITNMSHALNFDFSAYDPSNYFKTMRVHPTEGGNVRSFEELGTGQQQILALCFAHAYAKSFLGQGLIFVLDEPEAHLHPLAQKWLARQMFKMAEDGLQLVITTHSPYFINLEYLNSIYIVCKKEQTIVTNTNAEKLATHCIKTGAAKAEKKNILQFYALHSKPHILNGLFAKKIILVEGETEELSLPIYLDAIGFDTLKDGIAIISVGGKGNLAKWWRLFSNLKIPTFICFDNDNSDDSKGLKRKDALKAIGINEKNIEKLLTEKDWNLNQNFCVFGKNFEETMRNSFSNYEAYEEKEREKLGSSKPILARSVAMILSNEEELDDDIGWDNFRNLKDTIIALNS